MTENEHIDKVKQLAAKKELPILNETEFLTFQLDKSDELEIDEDDIVAYIPITFDANKAFGLDVCEDTSNDDIYLTAEWCLGDFVHSRGAPGGGLQKQPAQASEHPLHRGRRRSPLRLHCRRQRAGRSARHTRKL